MFFLASSHTKNTKSEKTNKHTIWLIYPKKRFEHMLFSKVIIIAFAHKKKLLKKLKRKQFQNRYQLRNLYPFQYQNQQISHEVNQ
jgi:hypothetical protein